MRGIVKTDFFWLFSGGFLLGTIGLFAMQPVDTTDGSARHFAGIMQYQR